MGDRCRCNAFLLHPASSVAPPTVGSSKCNASTRLQHVLDRLLHHAALGPQLLNVLRGMNGSRQLSITVLCDSAPGGGHVQGRAAGGLSGSSAAQHASALDASSPHNRPTLSVKTSLVSWKMPSSVCRFSSADMPLRLALQVVAAAAAFERRLPAAVGRLRGAGRAASSYAGEGRGRAETGRAAAARAPEPASPPAAAQQA